MVYPAGPIGESNSDPIPGPVLGPENVPVLGPEKVPEFGPEKVPVFGPENDPMEAPGPMTLDVVDRGENTPWRKKLSPAVLLGWAVPGSALYEERERT